MSTPRRAVVVGAGIAGLCCAYYLRRRGLEVTVVDGASVGARSASSWGNGGWICPAQAGPLPEPGLTVDAVRELASADSALYFKPTYLPKLAPWLARFWTYCNQRDFERGTAALAALGKRVFDLVDGMVADGIEFELYKRGMVCATATEHAARKVLDGLQPMRQHGFDLPEALLRGDELREMEPALSERAQAGFYLNEHWHVRANTMTVGIARKLGDMGVEIVEGAAVTDFDRQDATIRAVLTTKGAQTGDVFVLAAGSWTRSLANKLGVDFPMEPGKGYSFLVEPEVMPRHAILFADVHAGCTPFVDRLRIAGTMEFSGYELTVDDKRIGALYRRATQYIALATPMYHEGWVGLRPMTADGLPVIDWAAPYLNAYLATGYSMLGMTLSQPAGEALAEMIVTGTRPAVFEPFRIDRFPSAILRRPGG